MSGGVRGTGLALALMAALWLGTVPARAAGAPGAPTTDCRVAGLRNGVSCGMLARVLDPARPDGPKFDLHYVVVPAIARRKLPDPVFVLAGGPGQSAIEIAPALMGLLSRLGNRRDIVFVDQRGTGRSSPLACKTGEQELLAEQGDPERQAVRLARCRAELLARGHIRAADDLRFFTTPLAMQDLDAVRAALGAERNNQVGAADGTRAALEYQRQFLARVRRSVIDGVAPPDMMLPASFGLDGQAAFDAMLAGCEAEPACAARHPRLRADWAALLARLPQSVTVADPLTGRPETLVLTRDMLQGAVRGPLYSPALAAGLPVAISAAARGDFAALAGLGAVLSSRRGGQVALGMHFSVVCAEDMPLLERATAGGAAESREGSLRLYTQVCADWPRGTLPAAFYTLPPATAPVLLLSGGLDPATPPRHGARVAQALGALARHVVVPNAGHGVMGLGCMRDVVSRFIEAPEDQDALGVDAGCAVNIPRPPAFQPVGMAAELAELPR